MKFAFWYSLTCLSIWGLFYWLSPESCQEVLSFAFKFEPDHPVFYKRMLFMFLGLLLALMVELIIVGWNKSAVFKLFHGSKSARRDQFICLLFITGVLDFAGFLLTLGIPFFLGFKLNQIFPFLQQLQFIKQIEVVWLKIVLGFVLQDLFLYLGHRIMHQFNWLWEIHKYHHTATEMTIFSAHRNNPFARPIRSIVSSIPLVFLGVDFVSFLWILILADFLVFITHSEVDQDWGWVGKYIFISPRFHKVHHSVNPDHYGYNFGFAFVFWDRLFGTYKSAVKIEAIGAYDTLHNKGHFIEEMFSSMERIFYSLSKKTVKNK